VGGREIDKAHMYKTMRIHWRLDKTIWTRTVQEPVIAGCVGREHNRKTCAFMSRCMEGMYHSLDAVKRGGTSKQTQLERR
jgi:hypothetical protein